MPLLFFMDRQKFISLCFVCLFYSVSMMAQFTISGSVTNESKIGVAGATAVLLDQDSTMISFGITNTKGQFEFTEINQGEYFLQLSYVSYSTISQPCSISGNDKHVDLGEFMLIESNEILQEVTIKAEHIPMGIQGDTISYNTAAFKTRPGATVEDLLKKLPGIEVQRDGSIRAQGEDVENVLVDGKEFFGKDPKIATQNLEAEAVDKVQVYDKQSDIAEFTGIDDGQEEKTINLKLKEEYKSGGFGNINLQGGTSERYHSKLNYNRFNTNMQASVIASANNVNKQAFSFSEYISLMGGLSAAMSGNFNDFSLGEFGQSRTPEGITDNYTSGINFNLDVNEKLTLNNNYFYLKSDRQLNETGVTNQFLNSQTFNSIDTSTQNTTRQQHRINTKLIYKHNPFTHIEIKNSIGFRNGDQLSNNNSIFGSINGYNQSSLFNQLKNSGINYTGSVQLRKKFSKKGRNWINGIKYNSKTSDETTEVLNTFNSIGLLRNIEQDQFYQNNEREFQFNSSYTEPLGSGHYLSLQYSFNTNEESPAKDFFDIENNQTTLNKDLSASFIKDYQFHNAGLSIKRNRKKSKFTIAAHYQQTQLNAMLSQSDTAIKNTFNHILPALHYNLDLNNTTTLKTSYNTFITAPLLQQLLPIPDNANPNILILGNPNLRPAYTHAAQINLNHFDNFNFRNLFANFQLSLIKDRVVNRVDIDDNFLRTITPINTDKFLSLQSYVSYSQPIKALKLKYRISAQAYISDYLSYLNNVKSEVTESNTFLSFTLENRKKETIDLAGGLKVDYNTRSYKINESFNQSFFNYTFFVDGSWQILKNLILSTEFDLIKYSGEDFSTAQDFVLWNASIEKTFAENKFALQLSVFDILGQNRGISRTGGFNSIRDSKFNALTRYVSLGIRYRIGRSRKSGIQIDGL